MDTINFDEFKELMSKRSTPSISIYMPVHKKGSDSAQNPIRFKNLLRDAENKLKGNYKQNETDDMLKQAKLLLDDTEFWTRQSDGLAAFISPGDFFYYRIPETFEEKIIVSDRFYLRPLFKVANGNGLFFILALNQKNLKLYEATKYNIKEIKIKGLTESVEDYLGDEAEDSQVQFHTQTASRTIGGGIYSGSGSGNYDVVHDERLQHYFGKVASILQEQLGYEKAPLLLAGTEYLIPLYKEVNNYSNTIDAVLPININGLNDAELLHSSWEIAKPAVEKSLEKALSLYNNYANTSRSSEKAESIVKHSFSNRILYLFINKDANIPGRFDKSNYRVELGSGSPSPEIQDVDLIDLAAEQTLLHNGEVFLLDAERMPNGKEMAALLRY